jgi:hypothetical protein
MDWAAACTKKLLSDGCDGFTGSKGFDGFNGLDGLDGLDGLAGFHQLNLSNYEGFEVPDSAEIGKAFRPVQPEKSVSKPVVGFGQTRAARGAGTLRQVARCKAVFWLFVSIVGVLVRSGSALGGGSVQGRAALMFVRTCPHAFELSVAPESMLCITA